MVYDYYCDLHKFPPEFRQWSDRVTTFVYKKETPFFQILVPTVDTARFSYLLETCLDVQRSVLLTGKQRALECVQWGGISASNCQQQQQSVSGETMYDTIPPASIGY